MSLINDALKRANQPPPPPTRLPVVLPPPAPPPSRPGQVSPPFPSEPGSGLHPTELRPVSLERPRRSFGVFIPLMIVFLAGFGVWFVVKSWQTFRRTNLVKN